MYVYVTHMYVTNAEVKNVSKSRTFDSDTLYFIIWVVTFTIVCIILCKLIETRYILLRIAVQLPVDVLSITH